jgi:hypothetical protein
VRLILTQTAIVCVLVAVVYTIFLSPNGEGPLSGIQAPRGPQPGPAHVKRAQPKQARGGGGPVSVPAPAVVVPAAPGGFVQPPTDVEYKDSVAQLRALLKAADH